MDIRKECISLGNITEKLNIKLKRIIMGYYVASVGRYTAKYGDWEWDYIEENQSEEYYKNYKFDVEVKDWVTKKTYNYKVPIVNNFIILNSEIGWEHVERNCLFHWLFNKVSKKEKILARFYVDARVGSEYNRNFKEYYLCSPLKQPVKLSEEKQFYVVDDISIVEWAEEKGLKIEWVNEKGEKF